MLGGFKRLILRSTEKVLKLICTALCRPWTFERGSCYLNSMNGDNKFRDQVFGNPILPSTLYHTEIIIFLYGTQK